MHIGRQPHRRERSGPAWNKKECNEPRSARTEPNGTERNGTERDTVGVGKLRCRTGATTFIVYMLTIVLLASVSAKASIHPTEGKAASDGKSIIIFFYQQLAGGFKPFETYLSVGSLYYYSQYMEK